MFPLTIGCVMILFTLGAILLFVYLRNSQDACYLKSERSSPKGLYRFRLIKGSQGTAESINIFELCANKHGPAIRGESTKLRGANVATRRLRNSQSHVSSSCSLFKLIDTIFSDTKFLVQLWCMLPYTSKGLQAKATRKF
jgi:hypothetical protein